ncbi:Mannan endo-1,4-beta-mannosidase 6 [Triticum urartu]|uniref:mannan endo-1,4-beta-mannosidase n=1 Tax=Triticum urartu TaxID=4572 RepID=M7ZQ30_TRIUA|nr:Mannan endo-1,4-beta-mannosidase 6 [Triticum urartu]
MEALNPAALSKDVLGSREMPRLGRNTAELELDAVFELAVAGMSELTPRANQKGEAGRSDEVVVIETVPGGLRAEEDQEIHQAIWSVMPVLDYIIYEARRNHIRLILCLVNNLDNFGGKAQYVKWAQAAGANLTNSTDSFFYDPTVKGYYKDYVKAILTRRNSYSGIRYSDEPAIFAWELMNEPRCVSNSSGPHLQAWIAEMAAYVKSLDAKHLVAVGIEGFYGTGIAERLGFNPGDWAASLCSDFIQNSAVENIDFASVHAYPDSWLPKASMEEKLRYLSSWVDSHLNDSEHILKKPVLFSEVGYLQHVEGNSTVDRDILLRVVYDKIYDSARKLQAGGGAFIWQLMVEGTHMYHDDFSLVAHDHPSTYKLITEQSCRLQMLYENDRDPDWQCAIQP